MFEYSLFLSVRAFRTARCKHNNSNSILSIHFYSFSSCIKLWLNGIENQCILTEIEIHKIWNFQGSKC